MYIFYLYVQTVTRQCFCFPNSQWGVTAHDNAIVGFNQTSDMTNQVELQQTR